MKTRKLGIRIKIILYILAIYMVICTVVDVFFATIKKYVIEQYASASMGTALVAASEIDGDSFEKIKSDKDEYFQRAYDILIKYKTNSKIEYIYTIKLVDNELRFVIDTDYEEPAEFDEPYEDNKYMLEAIKSGKEIAEKEITSDEWGETISVYAPIKNSDNETVGIVGCDCEFSTLNKKLKKLTSVLYSVMTGFMAVCVIVALILSTGITKYLKELSRKIKNLNTGRKKGDKKLIVSSGDEIELVANEFNKFIGQFEKLVNNVSSVSGEINKNAAGINNMIEDSNSILEKMTVKLNKIKDKMLEATESTEVMANSLNASFDTIQCINEEALTSRENAVNYRNSAETLKNEIEEASDKTIEAINDFRAKLELNVKRCSEIENIDKITDGILKLADTTGILAENTHIEAARIGVHGKGFIVIAKNLNALNEQIRDLVKNVRDINREVKKSVYDLIFSVNELIKYLDEYMLKDYGAFIKIGQKYVEVMEEINDVLEQFSERTEKLSGDIETVKETVNGINDVISETSEKISCINDMSAELSDDIDELVNISDKNMSNSDLISRELSKYA